MHTRHLLVPYEDPVDVEPEDVFPLPLPGPPLGPETGAMSGAETGVVPPNQQFSEAMRVLENCELLLCGGYDEDERDNILNEIASLKTRFVRPATSRAGGSSITSTIARQRRYSLGAEARRVLKGWVDKHMEDPYPTVPEKQQLAAAAKLSIKQVNDWFTNYRKRHWEDEIAGRGLTSVVTRAI